MKKYEELDLSVVLFDAEDVITTSGGDAEDCPPVASECQTKGTCPSDCPLNTVK